MQRNLWKAAWAACLIVLSFSACSKEADLEERDADQELALSSISFELDVQEDELTYAEEEQEGEDGALRALDFLAEANKSGHPHPSLSLSLREGANVPMLLVFKNKTSGKSFVASDVRFSHKKGRLTVEEADLRGATDQILQNNPEDWSMLVVLGGTYNKGKLKFSATNRMPLQSRGNISLESVYMSGAWLPLTLKTVGSGAQRKRSFSVKNYNDASGQPIKLKNQCLTLMFRAAGNTGNAAVSFSGLELWTSNISFSGEFDLTEGALNVTKLPGYTAAKGSKRKVFEVASPVNVAGSTPSEYMYCVGVPLAATTNVRFIPLFGANKERSAHHDKIGVTIQKGAYAGLSNLKFGKSALRHPIEAVLTNSDGTVRVLGGVSVQEALSSNRGITENGTYRVYQLPTLEEQRVLLPTLRDSKKLLPKNIHAIMDFQRRESWNGSEKISPWGRPARDYPGAFQPGGNNIFYATRFGGDRDYYSAYRYERKGNDVEIRVRVLAGKTKRVKVFGNKYTNRPYTIGDIANEKYWNNEELGWNEEEYKLRIPSGIYWSSNSDRRVGGQTVYHGMKIFTSRGDDGLAAKPDAAYTGRDDYKSFADNPKYNPSHNAMLMTRQP